MNSLRLTILCTCLVALTACGYQMRGSAKASADMGSTYIQSVNPRSPLVKDLQRVLANSGSRVVFESTQADAVIRITRDDLTRRVLTVSETTRVQEFMLDYEVEFRVTDASGKVVVPNQELELHQFYEFSETQVLGKSGQQQILSEEMHREMAALIMDRIATSTRRNES